MTHEVEIASRLIGVVEDDDVLRSALQRGLEDEGFRVMPVSNGRTAVERLPGVHPATVVLDIGLPDADGRDVCQALRAAGMNSPVLFLTARDAVADRISGFNAGGDDYVVKPFALGELVARVHALLRRAPTEPGVGRHAGLRLDPAAHRVTGNGRALSFGPTEFRLLHYLMTHPNRVYSRTQLLDEVWGDHVFIEERTVDVHIRRLRQGLGPSGHDALIETVRGSGYALRP